MEYFLVYIRPLGGENDRYNLVKASSIEAAEEKVRNLLISLKDNPDRYFIQAQKTII
jgi:hypothetical protein